MAKEVGSGRTAGTRRRKEQTMTNGTVIRYMDDEHLVDVIRCPYPRLVGQPCEKEQGCLDCKLEWLKKEAEYGRADQPVGVCVQLGR